MYSSDSLPQYQTFVEKKLFIYKKNYCLHTMRAPFSDLAKQVLASDESAAQLRKFLGANERRTSITVKDEKGKEKIIRVEKLDDIATTKNL